MYIKLRVTCIEAKEMQAAGVPDAKTIYEQRKNRGKGCKQWNETVN
jgi:hypothetical protein